MTVHVLLFAAMRERLGLARCSVEVPAGATAATVKAALAARYPEAAGLIAVAKLAINECFADDDEEVLDPTATLALIPPVSGG